MKLHQYLSKTGKFSIKKDVIRAIKNSEIVVDGKTKRVVTNIMHDLKKNDKIYWMGRELNIIQENVYIVLNKPVGYLSSKLTPLDIKLGKKSVFDLLSQLDLSLDLRKTLFCVGRLDEDSSGLLIMTNDGKLGLKLTDPKNEIKKTYIADLEFDVDESSLDRIRNGIVIELEENGFITEYRTKKCEIEILDDRLVKLSIIEGKKREIRRMFETVGNRVRDLQRISIGTLQLGNLREGECRLVERLDC